MGLSELLSTYGHNYIQGLLCTWSLTAISFCFVLLLSTVITILRISPFKPFRIVGDVYVQIFRNIPGVALLIIIVYALPSLQLVFSYHASVLITAILLGSAFGSENFMSGINTINVGQIEAARSIGLSFFQIVRHVVIPQALRSVVLPMTNLCIAVMLTTALGSQVPLNPQELTGVVSFVNTRDTGGILAFAISAFGYLTTAFVVSFIGNLIDKKVRFAR